MTQDANSVGLGLLTGDSDFDDSLDAALQRAIDGDVEVLLVLESDLYREAARQRVDAALGNISTLVVLDHQRTATAERADLLLPAASFAEGDGTLVSQEGRAQRFFQVFDPEYYNPEVIIRESWRWLHVLQRHLQYHEVEWTQLDQATAACEQATPALKGIVDAAPDASFRIKGLRVAREPHRYSGRTAMRANLSVHEPRAPQDADSPLAFSMEGYSGTQEDRQMVPFAWSPGWNSPQAWNKFQDEVGGHLRAGDPGVRLFKVSAEARRWQNDIPAASRTTDDGLNVVPLHHLFGSEENTARAKPIQERAPEPYVALGDAAATRLGVAEGDTLAFEVNGQNLSLPVKIDHSLAAGLAGLPVGMTGLPGTVAGLVLKKTEAQS